MSKIREVSWPLKLSNEQGMSQKNGFCDVHAVVVAQRVLWMDELFQSVSEQKSIKNRGYAQWRAAPESHVQGLLISFKGLFRSSQKPTRPTRSTLKKP